MDVVSLGACASDLVTIVDTKHPDIMLVDLNMPGDAFAAIEDVSGRASDTKIIVFTASTSSDHAVRALSAGAAGFVLKGSQATELVEAIDTARRGDVFITPSFAARVISALHAKTAERRAQQNEVRLSVREEQIVKLLLCGKQNREIASALDLSEKTVKSYMTNLMAKLHARNRLEVVIAAQKFMPEARPPQSDR